MTHHTSHTTIKEMGDDEENKETATSPPQESDGGGGAAVERHNRHEVYYPAFTVDYVLGQGPYGLGLFANRDIPKGSRVLSDSIEFLFSEVKEGDCVRFARIEEARQVFPDLPDHFPLGRDVLLRSHGIPILQEDGRSIRWYLEVPGMFMNHSCHPSVAPDRMDDVRGEDYATRDIAKGEELTVDYALAYYDHGPFFETSERRGNMMGFKGLSQEDKNSLLPVASEAVRVMYQQDQEKTLHHDDVQENLSSRSTTTEDDASILRMVYPPPSHALANVIPKRRETDDGRYGLFATKDFAKGDLVYDFWWQDWPRHKNEDNELSACVVDMVFSGQLVSTTDPKEGTVIRMDPKNKPNIKAMMDQDDKLKFSGWDMLVQHSSSKPNCTYSTKEHEDQDDWQAVYATQPIAAGEELFVDYNLLFWDYQQDGIGFCHLSPSMQTEKAQLTWLHEQSGQASILGEALSSHVRKCGITNGLFESFAIDQEDDDDDDDDDSD